MTCFESREGYNQVMKTFLILLIGLLSTPVLACKPAPLDECPNGMTSVDQKSFAQLLKKIKKYQAQMDRVIKYPENRTSCFNNHFAGYYGDRFVEELKKNKGKSCTKNILAVERSFRNLVRTDSIEFKSLPKGGQDYFEEEAENLDDEIKSFFKSIRR